MSISKLLPRPEDNLPELPQSLHRTTNSTSRSESNATLVRNQSSNHGMPTYPAVKFYNFNGTTAHNIYTNDLEMRFPLLYAASGFVCKSISDFLGDSTNEHFSQNRVFVSNVK